MFLQSTRDTNGQDQHLSLLLAVNQPSCPKCTQTSSMKRLRGIHDKHTNEPREVLAWHSPNPSETSLHCQEFWKRIAYCCFIPSQPWHLSQGSFRWGLGGWGGIVVNNDARLRGLKNKQTVLYILTKELVHTQKSRIHEYTSWSVNILDVNLQSADTHSTPQGNTSDGEGVTANNPAKIPHKPLLT